MGILDGVMDTKKVAQPSSGMPDMATGEPAGRAPDSTQIAEPMRPGSTTVGGSTPGSGSFGGIPIPRAAGYTPAKTTASTYSATGYQPKTMTAEGYDAKTYNPERMTAGTYQAQGYDAERRTVQDNETVQGQLAKVIDSGSPILERARARALEQMNARGLMNSSMATTAALDAVLGQALNIATPDAQTYAQAAAGNQQAANEASRFRAAATNDASQFNTAQGNDAAARNMAAGNEAAQANTAAQNAAAQYRAGANNEASRLNMQAGNEAAQFQANATNEASRFSAAATNEANQFNVGAENTARGAEAAAQNQLIQQGMQAWTQLSQMQVDAQNKERLMALEQNYRTLTNGSAAAAASISQLQTGIQQILADPNIAQENKQGLIDRLIQNTQNGLRAIGVVHGMNFGNLLSFGGSTGPTNPLPPPNVPPLGPTPGIPAGPGEPAPTMPGTPSMPGQPAPGTPSLPAPNFPTPNPGGGPMPAPFPGGPGVPSPTPGFFDEIQPRMPLSTTF